MPQCDVCETVLECAYGAVTPSFPFGAAARVGLKRRIADPPPDEDFSSHTTNTTSLVHDDYWPAQKQDESKGLIEGVMLRRSRA
jgi:hypothetical protein